MSEDLRFPIGRFDQETVITAEKRNQYIETIEKLPAVFRNAVSDLSAEQLNEPYRPGGWTIRQLVHHMADSHMNSFIRFKLALSENAPTIKTYDEALWAEMADAGEAPIELSLMIMDGVHARWTLLLRSLSDADFEREVTHPERGKMSLNAMLALYDWHSRHHTAHITSLRERLNWM